MGTSWTVPRAWLPCLGLTALAALAAPPAATAAPKAPAAGVTTAWTLVASVCTSAETQADRACYDTGGYLDPSTWSVHEDSADWTEPPGYWNAQFSYPMPESIAGSGATIPLALDATSQENGGVSMQLCVKAGSYLSVDGPNGPCVRAVTEGHASATGSKTVTITPTNAPTGTLDTVIVDPGDGPYIYFTYRAKNPQDLVSFGFNADAPPATHGAPKYSIAGHGTFRITRPDDLEGKSVSGTAKLERTHGDHLSTAKLEVIHATAHLDDQGNLTAVSGKFEVTHSSLPCLHEGKHVVWRIVKGDGDRRNSVAVDLPSCDYTLFEIGSVHISSSAA